MVGSQEDQAADFVPFSEKQHTPPEVIRRLAIENQVCTEIGQYATRVEPVIEELKNARVLVFHVETQLASFVKSEAAAIFPPSRMRGHITEDMRSRTKEGVVDLESFVRVANDNLDDCSAMMYPRWLD